MQDWFLRSRKLASFFLVLKLISVLKSWNSFPVTMLWPSPFQHLFFVLQYSLSAYFSFFNIRFLYLSLFFRSSILLPVDNGALTASTSAAFPQQSCHACHCPWQASCKLNYSSSVETTVRFHLSATIPETINWMSVCNCFWQARIHLSKYCTEYRLNLVMKTICLNGRYLLVLLNYVLLIIYIEKMCHKINNESLI